MREGETQFILEQQLEIQQAEKEKTDIAQEYGWSEQGEPLEPLEPTDPEEAGLEQFRFKEAKEVVDALKEHQIITVGTNMAFYVSKGLIPTIERLCREQGRIPKTTELLGMGDYDINNIKEEIFTEYQKGGKKRQVKFQVMILDEFYPPILEKENTFEEFWKLIGDFLAENSQHRIIALNSKADAIIAENLNKVKNRLPEHYDLKTVNIKTRQKLFNKKQSAEYLVEYTKFAIEKAKQAIDLVYSCGLPLHFKAFFQYAEDLKNGQLDPIGFLSHAKVRGGIQLKCIKEYDGTLEDAYLEAADRLKNLVKQGGEIFNSYFVMGQNFLRAGRISEAQEMFKKDLVENNNPQRIEREYWGIIEDKKSQKYAWDETIDYLQVLTESSDFKINPQKLSQVYQEIGQKYVQRYLEASFIEEKELFTSKAIEMFAKAKDLNPKVELKINSKAKKIKKLLSKI